VHDAFGHSLEGAGFRARGEENAWQAHIRLYTGTAIHAATSETRGQNSWLNYGPHGETNRTAGLGDTVFALQKTGLMPAWTWTEGVVEDMPEAPGAFAARGEGQRIGEYYPALTEIRLGPQSNMSTFLHEMGHHFLEVHVKVASCNTSETWNSPLAKWRGKQESSLHRLRLRAMWSPLPHEKAMKAPIQTRPHLG
jgi:hypothetical protein